MKAYVIRAERREIETVDISGMDDIVNLVGYDTIEFDEIGGNGDKLYFDEECFIRGHAGRFQIDNMIPVAGTGVIVGIHNNGTELQDVHIGLDDLQQRLKYL